MTAPAVTRLPQWYATPQGALRLEQEVAAVRLFNQDRDAPFRADGRKHPDGHLVLAFRFRPLPSQPDVVEAEVVLSGQHPAHHPVARIVKPALQRGPHPKTATYPHLVSGEFARERAAGTIPAEWAAAAGQSVPCMYDHSVDGPGAWTPAQTAVSALLNVQSWFLSYLVWVNTGRWPLDQP